MAFDPQAVAVVRLDGPAIVKHVRALQDLGGLAAVGNHLRSVVLALSSGAEHTVTATLAYADDDAAAGAQVAAEETVGALSRSGNPKLAWLSSAHVSRAPKTVVVTAPLPAQLVGALFNAGSAPLDVDVPAPPR
jgi:hypothetical protein